MGVDDRAYGVDDWANGVDDRADGVDDRADGVHDRADGVDDGLMAVINENEELAHEMLLSNADPNTFKQAIVPQTTSIRGTIAIHSTLTTAHVTTHLNNTQQSS
eukprot:1386086-Amorphochlora_amoeboformis.AAC.1